VIARRTPSLDGALRPRTILLALAGLGLASAAGLDAGQRHRLAAQESRLPGAPMTEASALEAGTSTTPAPGTLRVTGRARRSLEVDRAILRFSVETEADDAAAATRSNAEIMARSMDRLRAHLGPDDRVSTGDLRLSPIYGDTERGARSREIVGYRMTHDLTVSLAALEQAGTVIDLAVEAGANRLNSISFVASNPDPARLEAIREATERAEAEARVMAETLGVRLGPPAEVTVSPAASSAPPAYRAMSLELASATPVEPGAYDLEVTVAVVYHLLSFDP
jgi:uncharacterized protein YggE